MRYTVVLWSERRGLEEPRTNLPAKVVRYIIATTFRADALRMNLYTFNHTKHLKVCNDVQGMEVFPTKPTKMTMSEAEDAG